MTAYSPLLSRRQLLNEWCAGFGSLALAGLMNELADAAADGSDGNPLTPKLAHFTPRAKRIIFLFMHGGPSQVDTFDYKPQLAKDHGKPLPFPETRVVFAKRGNLLASPWKFRQHGQSGISMSELWPHLSTVADQLCMIHSLHGTNVAHGGATMKLHTGSESLLRPSMGAWISYGLGTENQNLPSYITICPTSLHGGVDNFGTAFLPAIYQGVPLGTPGYPNMQTKDAKFECLESGHASRAQRRLQLDLLSTMNQRNVGEGQAHSQLEARIQSFELAFRMQAAAPEAMDVSQESQATRALYGLDDSTTANFGMQCLLARRFAERGVRFVQCTHSGTMPEQWDQHSELKSGHERNARQVDKPITGLLKDLQSRGLLEDTLVLWGGEFGRTPTAQGNGNGRDHHPQGFTMWLAGGGVKAGFRYGETDEYGYYAVRDKVHMHDLHASILHLLGLDHTRLTYPYAGREFRLTDVYGRVVTEIIA